MQFIPCEKGFIAEFNNVMEGFLHGTGVLKSMLSNTKFKITIFNDEFFSAVSDDSGFISEDKLITEKWDDKFQGRGNIVLGKLNHIELSRLKDSVIITSLTNEPIKFIKYITHNQLLIDDTLIDPLENPIYRFSN